MGGPRPRGWGWERPKELVRSEVEWAGRRWSGRGGEMAAFEAGGGPDDEAWRAKVGGGRKEGDGRAHRSRPGLGRSPGEGALHRPRPGNHPMAYRNAHSRPQSCQLHHHIHSRFPAAAARVGTRQRRENHSVERVASHRSDTFAPSLSVRSRYCLARLHQISLGKEAPRVQITPFSRDEPGRRKRRTPALRVASESHPTEPCPFVSLFRVNIQGRVYLVL